MSETKTFYKVVPKLALHPKNYKYLEKVEFDNIQKEKIIEGKSVCNGHDSTIIWLCDIGYIVQVILKEKEFFINTPCTHKPVFGMDSLDGAFAQEAEEYILSKEVGFQTTLLEIYNGKEEIDIVEYVKIKGFGENTKTIFSSEKVIEFDKFYKVAWDILKVFIFENINLTWFDKNKIKKAIKYLYKCIELFPDSWNSMWGMGKAYQALKDHKSALEWFEKAFEIEKNNPNVPREATLESLNQGLAKKAVYYAEKAIEIDSNDAGLYSNYALALLIEKRGIEAQKAIEKALELNPNDSVNKNVSELVKSIIQGKKPYPDKL